MSGVVAAGLAVLAAACALLAVVTVRRNRALRRRPGDVPALARSPGSGRWLPGHGVWVDDVFAFRRSPAGWSEMLLWVTGATLRPAADDEQARLRRVGDSPLVITFELRSGGSRAFAVRPEDAARLLGPYADRPGTRRS